MKENIEPIGEVLTRLMKMSVVGFNFASDPAKKRIEGFIAQDIQKIFPDAVSTNGDDGVSALKDKEQPCSVDYGRLTPLLTKAIQELKATNDNQASELRALRDEFQAYKAEHQH